MAPIPTVASAICSRCWVSARTWPTSTRTGSATTSRVAWWRPLIYPRWRRCSGIAGSTRCGSTASPTRPPWTARRPSWRRGAAPATRTSTGCPYRNSLFHCYSRAYYTAQARKRGQEPSRHISHPRLQPLPGLEPRAGEIVQQKTSAGAFATTGLAGLLHNLGVHDLLMAGQLTHGCLGMTAIEAVSWGYIVTMVADASAAPDSYEGRLAILRLFDQYWGRVRSTEEVVTELTRPEPEANRRTGRFASE